MTTVTGLTAERMLEIEAASVVDGDVVGGNLILTKHDGGQINAGSVVGPTGPQGPVGSDLDVISAVRVSGVGIINQIRAGRQLTLADFTDLGLSAPVALWNLASTSDSSGNGRTLTNKGTVTFASGINGAAGTAAQFTGAVGQALYIADTGASDPFRIKVGSIGCWFRTPHKGSIQSLITKRVNTPNLGWAFSISSTNKIYSRVSPQGTTFSDVQGQSDVCDNRWHFAVMTYDGLLRRVYVDGVVETTMLTSSLIFGANAPLNIGGFGADGSTNASEPNFGRVSNAFITNDILTEDQVRNLYCAKIPHTLAAIPGKVNLNVKRGRKGAALVTGDFPSTPLRLYNFSAGSLGNAGSQGATGDLTNVGTAVAAGGADGTPGNSFYLGGASALTSTDSGLPSGTATHSFGCWLKVVNLTGVNMWVVTWGTTSSSNDTRIYVSLGGEIGSGSGADAFIGPNITDGLWHFVVAVHDNAAIEGDKRKLYLDGRCVGLSTVLNSITLGGASKFCIGQNLAAASKFTGLVDAVFVIGAALTPEDILKLYTKSGQLLGLSPKNPGDHIEAMSSTDLLAIFDTLDSVHQVELTVAA